MTYPTDHHTGGTGEPSTAETSTNSLGAYAPPLYQDPAPVHDLEKGRQSKEDKEGQEDDDHAPEVVSQSSRTVTLAARAKHFSDTFLERLPYGVSHFLGYRREEPKPVHPVVAISWAFVGVLSSLLLITLATERIPAFRDNGSPVIVASFVCSYPYLTYPSRLLRARPLIHPAGRRRRPRVQLHRLPLRAAPQRHLLADHRFHRRRLHLQALRHGPQ